MSSNNMHHKQLGEVLIDVKGLKKHFGRLEVLKGVDLQVRRGEVVVIIGPSGSGKSTFLRSLNLLEKPNGGTITVEGQDIMAASAWAWCSSSSTCSRTCACWTT